jgi:RNA polymerase sigma-70 factor (ECF subfamily)
MSQLPDLTEASDHDVVAQAREGDEYAYREVVRRYGPRVFDLIYRMVGHRELAEDLTQETFVKAFRALDRHGPERKPAAWILRIANNTAIDYVRRKRPDSTRSPLTMTPGQIDVRATRIPLTSGTPTAREDLSEFAAALERAVGRLRPEYRRCFTLRHVERRSFHEIAQILGLPLGTVKSHLHRATQQLRRMLRASMTPTTRMESTPSAQAGSPRTAHDTMRGGATPWEPDWPRCRP